MHISNARRNHLYRLRRIRGLSNKQLAALLGYRSTSMISRLESGKALPSLRVALLLQIILGAHLPEIYADLHAALQELAIKRAARLPHLLTRSIRGRVLGKD
jgi:transcriptional regulator with XRE-family HTH domain